MHGINKHKIKIKSFVRKKKHKTKSHERKNVIPSLEIQPTYDGSNRFKQTSSEKQISYNIIDKINRSRNRESTVMLANRAISTIII